MIGKVFFLCIIALTVAVDEIQDSPPRFLENFETYDFEEYSHARVDCYAYGEQPMDYIWHGPGEALISRDDSSRIFHSITTNGSALYIRNINNGDWGMYKCSASNEHGLATKIYNISIFEKLDDNRTDSGNFSVKVIKVTDSSVSFYVTAPPRTRFIEVRYRDTLELRDNIEQWTYSGGNIYEIGNLKPSGRYFFQFIDTITQEELSRISEVILLPDVPEVIFRSLEKNLLQIDWVRKSDDIRRSTIDKYELSHYSVSRQFDDTWKRSDCEVTIEIPSCISPYYTIVNRYSNTYFEIRLRAHTSAGYGSFYRQKIRVW